MQSGTSFFNLTLFRKNMTRFWPLWAVYLVVWLIALPANLLVNYRNNLDSAYDSLNFVSYMPTLLLRNVGIPLSAVFCIFAAMAVFSYLCNSRSACLIHALPILREGLFITNYLSGLSYFVLPNVLVFLLTLLAEAICGHVDLGILCLWFLGVNLLPLFFYSFGVFCAMFTGNLLALPAFYGILNWLGLLLSYLISNVLSSFIFGYSGQATGSLLDTLGNLFTPVWNLYLSCRTGYTYDSNGVASDVTFMGLSYLFLYAGVGVLFAVAALLLYRKRRIERAGDVVTVAPLRPVFKYGFAFCTALSLGSLLNAIFSRFNQSGQIWSLLGFMLLSGAIGYFAAEMLLQKSFRVFSKWKGCVVFLLCLVAVTAAMDFDLLGFEGKVPSADSVSSVEITVVSSSPNDSGSSSTVTVTDPAIIQRVITLHQDIVKQKAEIEASGPDYSASYPEGAYTDFTASDSAFKTFVLSYTLKTGQILSRNYSNLPISSEALQNPESYASQLQSLISDPTVTTESYFSNLPDGAVLNSANIGYYDTATKAFSTKDYDQAEAQSLYNTVCADLSAGNLGHRYLLEDQERYQNCYYNDITFIYSVPIENPVDTAGGSYEQNYVVTVTLQPTASNTLAFLGDDFKSGLLTLEQYQALGDPNGDPDTVKYSD